MGRLKKLPLVRRWGMFFGLWLFLLSGLVSDYLKSPGILQAIRIKTLFESKEKQLGDARSTLRSLQTTANELQNNRFAQAREIRRVLGYAAQDEIIFDFNHAPEEGKNGPRESKVVQ